MNLSPSQESAILDSRQQVLVSAGAGSGKTRLLVAYFVRALVAEGIPAEHLVAVTFTRKAAAELVSRIRSSLEACGRSDLARSLDSSFVGTIHGLCRRLLRDHALEAGVDPASSVLEAEAADLVKQEVLKVVWEKVIEEADETELEVLASRGDTFRKTVVPIYEKLRGIGVEHPRIEIPAVPFDKGATAHLTESVREALRAGQAVERPGKLLQCDLMRLEDCLQWLEQPLAPTERARDLGLTESFFPSRHTRSMERWFVPVREALGRYRSGLAVMQLGPVVSAMNRLLEEFHEQYGCYKQERGLLDFADLELGTRTLVTSSRGGSLPALLPGSRMLIDEFQDTNDVQCSILESLGADQILMVGDERQSIYRFRGADVTVFRARERKLQMKNGGERGGGVHRLDVNYRSRREILGFINRLFAHETFFGPDFVPLKAPESDDVVSNGAEATVLPAPTAVVMEKPGVERKSGAVEILVAERDASDDPDARPVAMQQAEAEVVASRIRRAIDHEGLRLRDIVVLLPTQTNVDLYQQALEVQGAAVYVVRGKGYYSQEEVADVVSMLRLLVNPHDDLALAAVLRSPLAGVSDDALYLLGRQRREHGHASLWEVLREERTSLLGSDDRQLVSEFIVRLVELRRRVGRPGLASLIDDVTVTCDYDISVLSSLGGGRRFANVRKLMRLADEFETLEGPDLGGFVDLLESLGDLSDREGNAPTLAEGDDVVRIMTVHQAKGLEFPMVVLAGLGSDVYHGPVPEFVIGDDGRVGVFLKGSARRQYENHDLCWGPAVQLIEDQRLGDSEEDARLLYVAMTRAEERLVLVGARPRNDDLAKGRIGRILRGAGLDVVPEAGTPVPIAALDAVVEVVARSSAGAAESKSDAPALTQDLAPGSLRSGTVRVTHSPAGYERDPEFVEMESKTIGLRHISFSALAAYRRCPRQFYLERILGLSLPLEPTSGPTVSLGRERSPWLMVGAPEPACGEDTDSLSFEFEAALDDEEQRAGRDVGLLVHALLETLPLVEGPPTEATLRSAADDWLSSSGAQLATPAVDRAMALTKAFWESPIAREPSLATCMKEASFFFAQDDVMVSGVMDVVIRTDEEWRIVDYKTNTLFGRQPAQVADNYALQATVYCLAALRAGAPAVRMEFIFLERPDSPVCISYAHDDIIRLERDLEEALAGLRRAEFPMRTGEACTWCPVAGACASMAPS